jgi:hypothetical protein
MSAALTEQIIFIKIRCGVPQYAGEEKLILPLTYSSEGTILKARRAVPKGPKAAHQIGNRGSFAKN